MQGYRRTPTELAAAVRQTLDSEADLGPAPSGETIDKLAQLLTPVFFQVPSRDADTLGNVA